MRAPQISSDDPRLTAYVLGELDPAEKAEIEAALRDDPAARAAVRELEAVARSLRTALTEEEIPPGRAAPALLPPDPDASLRDRLGRWGAVIAIGGLAAACAAILLVREQGRREIARPAAAASAPVPIPPSAPLPAQASTHEKVARVMATREPAAAKRNLGFDPTRSLLDQVEGFPIVRSALPAGAEAAPREVRTLEVALRVKAPAGETVPTGKTHAYVSDGMPEVEASDALDRAMVVPAPSPPDQGMVILAVPVPSLPGSRHKITIGIAADGALTCDGRPMTPEALGRWLRDEHAAHGAPMVVIDTDAKTPVEALKKVWDLCAKAGIKGATVHPK